MGREIEVKNNKEKGQGVNSLARRNAMGRTINFGADVACDGPIETIEKLQEQTQRLLLLLPLFASFSGDHVGTQGNQTYPEYNKTYPIRQGQVLEEIAGKTNADNIFAKVSNGFGPIFPGFLIKKMAHTNSFRLVPSAKAARGKAAADGTEMKCFEERCSGENESIIASRGVLSNA